MAEFKVGDLVQVVNYSLAPAWWGLRCTVTKVNGEEVLVLPGLSWPDGSASADWFNKHSLELVADEGDDFVAEDDSDDEENIVGFLLSPSDPFEAVIIDIVQTNRRKRHDYVAAGTSPWSNFDTVEDQTGTPFGTATEVLIATKQARLKALGTRPGGPQNESVEDTLLDRAVYSVIALGRHRYPEGVVK